MPLPSSRPLDVATADQWHGLRPGMTRSEALAVLAAAGAERSEDANDPGWMLVTAANWGLELRFAEDGEQRLRQIALDDDETLWAGQKVIERRLHDLLAIVGGAAAGAGWRPEDANALAFDDLQPPGQGPFADEALLDEGTLWLPRRGLGVVMCAGVVNELVWRQPEDVPTQLVGPVTEAQKQLSARPDLDAALRKHWASPSEGDPTLTSRSNPLQWLVNVLTILALSYVGWRGWQELKLWQGALILPATLVSIEKATGKPWRDHFLVKFNDPTGRPQTIALEPADFYVAPREPGDETQVCYAPGNPPRVVGPARVRDEAFLHYTPWAIGIGGLYVLATAACSFVGRIRRTAPPPGPPSAPAPFTPDRGR